MLRIPAHKRLAAMPEVFTTNTLAVHLDVELDVASVYLNRWKEEGLVSSLGKRAGVHFNLVRNPNAHSDNRLDAVGLLLPGAVIGGASAIHAAGWTTQIPWRLEVLAQPRRSYPSLNDVTVSKRSKSWFAVAKSHLLGDGPLPFLKPAFALADSWVNNIWRPDPDDLEWDLIDKGEVEMCFAELGAEMPDMLYDPDEDRPGYG